MSSIVCSDLSFAWPDDVPLFDDLSFSVGDGRTGLVAPNGAGTSALLRLIAGDLTPTAGSMKLMSAVYQAAISSALPPILMKAWP